MAKIVKPDPGKPGLGCKPKEPLAEVVRPKRPPVGIDDNNVVNTADELPCPVGFERSNRADVEIDQSGLRTWSWW